MKRHFGRREEIQRLIRKLEWDGYPRVQMFMLVMLTGVAGMAASYGFLVAGVESMIARYPLSVGCAYLVFLLLLWLWLRTKADDYLDSSADLLQPVGSHLESPQGHHHTDFAGGGGQSGGGGASGGFELNEPLPSPSSIDIPGADSVGGTVGDAISGADEGAIPIAVAVVVAALAALLLFAMMYVVYLAPSLFAELLVDGVLSASLYRRLKGLQTRHWLESAVRRTFLPFAVTALTLAAVGYAFHAYAPQAHTLGEVLQHYRNTGAAK